MKRWVFLIMSLLLVGATFGRHTSPLTAQALPRSHVVMPGDTWAALAWRYDLSPEDIAAQQSINRQRQPVIGTTLLLPDTAVDHPGTLHRVYEAGVLETAVRQHTSPWTLALQNALPHPYWPLLYQPLFFPGGHTPPRDLPIGFQTLELSASPAHPGQALGIRAQLTHPLSVTMQIATQSVAIFRNDNSLVGLSGSGAFFPPGAHELNILPTNQPLWSQPWLFADLQWDYDSVTLTGSAAQIDQDAILRERQRLFEIWEQATPQPQWDNSFRLPLESYLFVSSNYGARRSYNGGPFDRYHEGVDFAAYGGTPVQASAPGTVVVAETLFVRGGTVIVDHGLGVYTGYYHLSNVLVLVGDSVAAGQIVGEVGSTGLSTGNHLHWDLLVNATWVDAAAWLEQGMDCWLLDGLARPCPLE